MGHGTGGLTHATVRKNVISGNTATSGGGGGIFACAGPIENNVICGNYAPALGAGILVCQGRIETFGMGALSQHGVTPFFRMMLPYFAVSPVITTAKAFLARS